MVGSHVEQREALARRVLEESQRKLLGFKSSKEPQSFD